MRTRGHAPGHDANTVGMLPSISSTFTISRATGTEVYMSLD
jgi:hypothetical protein